MSMGIPSLSKVLGVLTSSFIGKEEVFSFLFSCKGDDKGTSFIIFFLTT